MSALSLATSLLQDASMSFIRNKFVQCGKQLTFNRVHASYKRSMTYTLIATYNEQLNLTQPLCNSKLPSIELYSFLLFVVNKSLQSPCNVGLGKRRTKGLCL